MKCVAITGGFGSLGSAVAACLDAQGWRVALIDQATAGASSLPSRALVLGGVDLSSAAAAQQALARLIEHTGRLDALVNVAGTFRWHNFESGGAVDSFDQLYTVNLRTAVLATQAALPRLLAQTTSAIVNIGAAGAQARATTGMAAYAASKAGVAKLTEALADEFKDRGLRANAVLPGIIDTPANRAAMPDSDFTRWVTPADVAEVVRFLLSDAARAVTAALVPVTGRL